MNWQEAIVKIFLIFAETAAGQPMPADRKQEVALLWCRHVERYAQGYFIRKGVPRHEAEDLAQDVILKIFRAPSLADVAYPKAYFHRVMNNLFVDYLRSRPPEESLYDEDGAYLDEPIDPGLAPDDLAYLRRTLAGYERAFPPKHQRLSLWADGYSASEIASVELDIPVDSVTKRQASTMTQSVYATLKHFRAGLPWSQEPRR